MTTTNRLTGMSAFLHTATGLLLLLALATVVPAAAATKIYRTVDEDGNVVFTDVPPRNEQPGDAVELESSNSFTPPPDAGSRSLEAWLGNEEGTDEGEDGDQSSAMRYESLSIASPANDAALRDNAGNVTVAAALRPELATGHTMQVYLDGQLMQSGRATTFQLTNVDRGSHDLQLRVVDQGGNTVIASDPSVFHLQRRSLLLQPNNRKSAAN